LPGAVAPWLQSLGAVPAADPFLDAAFIPAANASGRRQATGLVFARHAASQIPLNVFCAYDAGAAQPQPNAGQPLGRHVSKAWLPSGFGMAQVLLSVDTHGLEPAAITRRCE